jgi:hypothetical protein
MKVKTSIAFLTLIFLGLAGIFVLVARSLTSTAPAYQPVARVLTPAELEKKEYDRIIAERAILTEAMRRNEELNPISSTTLKERLETLSTAMEKNKDLAPSVISN